MILFFGFLATTEHTCLRTQISEGTVLKTEGFYYRSMQIGDVSRTSITCQEDKIPKEKKKKKEYTNGKDAINYGRSRRSIRDI